MNFQTAAIAAGAAFLLSFLAGLIGGVPLLDIVLRAFLWAAVGFGGSLGVEALLRSLVPDLFTPLEESVQDSEDSGPSVDITLEEEVPVPGAFVEEVDEGRESPPVQAKPEVRPAPSEPRMPVPPPPEVPAFSPAGSEEEEMPEIGSFLDAFKPDSPETGEEPSPSAPEYGEYTPVEPDRRSSSGEVTIDGEAQDPAILAKAVQTVMKRDTQGN